MGARIAGVMLIVSIAVMALSMLVVPVLIARLPADYFVREAEAARPKGTIQPAASRKRSLVFWLSNVAGALLVALGILMLVLPGQGVLTILAGLSLLSFPGKRRLQLRLLRTPVIRRAIDALRKRAGKPPLCLDAPDGDAHCVQ